MFYTLALSTLVGGWTLRFSLVFRPAISQLSSPRLNTNEKFACKRGQQNLHKFSHSEPQSHELKDQIHPPKSCDDGLASAPSFAPHRVHQGTVDFSNQTTRRKVKVVGPLENQEVLPKSMWTWRLLLDCRSEIRQKSPSLWDHWRSPVIVQLVLCQQSWCGRSCLNP